MPYHSNDFMHFPELCNFLEVCYIDSLVHKINNDMTQIKKILYEIMVKLDKAINNIITGKSLYPV